MFYQGLYIPVILLVVAPLLFVPKTMWKKIHKRLLNDNPYKTLFGTMPGIIEADKRWALFQIILSAVFSVIAIAVGFLTINTSNLDGAIMAIAVVLFSLGILGLVYGLGLGLYWYSKRHVIDNDVEAKRILRDDRLHQDMERMNKNFENFIEELRQERNERNNRPKP